MADGDRLLLPSVAGEGAAQLLDLADGGLVPSSQALHRQGQEDNTLGVAGLSGLVQLPLVGNGESMSWGLGSLSHKSCL